MTYFVNVHTLDELKKQYRRLATQNHPDHGGDLETMKAINAEHDALFEVLKAQQNRSADEDHQTTETAEEFRDIIAVLLRLDGLEIEELRHVLALVLQIPSTSFVTSHN